MTLTILFLSKSDKEQNVKLAACTMKKMSIQVTTIIYLNYFSLKIQWLRRDLAI